MNVRLLFVLSLFSSGKAIAQEIFLSEREELVVMEQARALCASIELYSGAKGGRVQSKGYTEIFDFFNRDGNRMHASDLFAANQYGDRVRNISGYLDEIDSDYENNIDVSYDNFEVHKCIIENSGEKYVRVKVSKKLTYKKQVREFVEYINFSLGETFNNLKVNEVVFPTESALERGCDPTKAAETLAAVKKQNQTEFEQLVRTADAEFKTQKFYEAKTIYTGLLKYQIREDYLRKQIVECDKSITLVSSRQRADILFQGKKYPDALTEYKAIIRDFPNADLSEVRSKIETCQLEIRRSSYAVMIKNADYFFEGNLFNKAQEYYLSALEFIPGDRYALARIEICKSKGLEIAREEIKNAVLLAEASPQNYGKAFKIFYTYEESGLLTAQNYYFMAMMLDGRERSVRNEMEFSNRDFRRFMYIYCPKLRRASEKENYEKGLDLLNYILSEKYQRN